MKTVKSLFVIILIAAVAIFAVQNAATVEIDFLVWSVSLPRVIMIIGLFSTGVLLGLIISGLARVGSGKK